MKGIKNLFDGNSVAVLAVAGVCLQWLSQPPMCLWFVAFGAIVPWLILILRQDRFSRRQYTIIWVAGLVYWMFTLQGLRNAHPAIYVGWFLLSAYLSLYTCLFVSLCRQMRLRRVPIWLSAPVVWVGLECIRGYFASGISAVMLGHSMADVPEMIQIASLFGSYGVSFVVVSVNVAIVSGLMLLVGQQSKRDAVVAIVAAVVLLVCTLVYGMSDLESKQPKLATFALIQRSEPVEFVQNQRRELEIFDNYTRQTLSALRKTNQAVDAVVWPESMFSGGLPWWFADKDAAVPSEYKDKVEFATDIQQRQRFFLNRAQDLQNAFRITNQSDMTPELIVGCGVIHFRDYPNIYSGAIHMDSSGKLADWYGKTHLVMVGEYFPIVGLIPGIYKLLPQLTRGEGPKSYLIGETNVSPNICIETAIEHVTIDHINQLYHEGKIPDVVVAVTNDAWFDNSSVVDHHLRCSQLVAVGARRPILSAANNGPTAWIDSRGQLVERLETGDNGSIIATPNRDSRVSLYVRIRDWPARILALVCVVFWIDGQRLMRKERRKKSSEDLE